MEIDYEKRFRTAFEQIIVLAENGQSETKYALKSLANIEKMARAQLRNVENWKTGATKDQ